MSKAGRRSDRDLGRDADLSVRTTARRASARVSVQMRRDGEAAWLPGPDPNPPGRIQRRPGRGFQGGGGYVDVPLSTMVVPVAEAGQNAREGKIPAAVAVHTGQCAQSG